MPIQSPRPAAKRNRMRGVTLIELMIALGFGLVLIIVTLSLFITNKQTFRQVENLSRLNENARIAFELLGRDFREAGATPCGNMIIGSALNTPNDVNFKNGQKGLSPYGKTQAMPSKDFGTSAAQRVNGTDAVVISYAAADSGITVEAPHDPNGLDGDNLKLNKLGTGFVDGEIILACNNNFATIFQITNVKTLDKILVHDTGNTETPGNCTKYLYQSNGIIDCTSANGISIAGATIAKVVSTSWYIANNGRGGRSLYRIVSPSNTPEEMVENITQMEIEYLPSEALSSEPYDYVISTNYATTTPAPKGGTAGTYTWWPSKFNLTAARVTLTLQTPDAVGADGQPISRQVSTVFSLRNQIF